jgi:hypothetical protein
MPPTIGSIKQSNTRLVPHAHAYPRVAPQFHSSLHANINGSVRSGTRFHTKAHCATLTSIQYAVLRSSTLLRRTPCHVMMHAAYTCFAALHACFAAYASPNALHASFDTYCASRRLRQSWPPRGATDARCQQAPRVNALRCLFQRVFPG